MALNEEPGFVCVVCLLVCLPEKHNKHNKMKDERGDQKCSYTDLLTIRDDVGIKILQSS